MITVDADEYTEMPTKPTPLFGRPDDAQPGRQRCSVGAASAAAAAATESSDPDQGDGGIFPPPAPEVPCGKGKGQDKSKSKSQNDGPADFITRWPNKPPCEFCNKRMEPRTVWIATKYGERFHVDRARKIGLRRCQACQGVPRLHRLRPAAQGSVRPFIGAQAHCALLLL